jgi:hypothetical protein
VRLEIVPGASHLFEEPGTLEQVARLTLGWFQRYLHSRAVTRQPHVDRQASAADQPPR